MSHPIELYTGNTLDGRRVSIALAELGLPYTLHDVDTKDGAHRTAEFLRMSPPGQIPALIDARSEPAANLFESVAILQHLARAEGALWPTGGAAEIAEAESWLMYVSSLGVVAAQAHYFRRGAPSRSELAIDRFEAATRRRYATLNERLVGRDWILDAYSMVDISAYPWVIMHHWQEIDLSEYPELERWRARLDDRPAVQAGLKVPRWNTSKKK